MMKRPEFLETKRTPRYSLRKLNVGVASVLLGVTIFGINFTDHSVKAATTENVGNFSISANSNSQRTSAAVLTTAGQTKTQETTSTTEKVQQNGASNDVTEKVQQNSGSNNATANNSTESAPTSQSSPETQGSAGTDINSSAFMNLMAASDTGTDINSSAFMNLMAASDTGTDINSSAFMNLMAASDTGTDTGAGTGTGTNTGRDRSAAVTVNPDNINTQPAKENQKLANEHNLSSSDNYSSNIYKGTDGKYYKIVTIYGNDYVYRAADIQASGANLLGRPKQTAKDIKNNINISKEDLGNGKTRWTVVFFPNKGLQNYHSTLSGLQSAKFGIALTNDYQIVGNVDMDVISDPKQPFVSHTFKDNSNSSTDITVSNPSPEVKFSFNPNTDVDPNTGLINSKTMPAYNNQYLQGPYYFTTDTNPGANNLWQTYFKDADERKNAYDGTTPYLGGNHDFHVNTFKIANETGVDGAKYADSIIYDKRGGVNGVFSSDNFNQAMEFKSQGVTDQSQFSSYVISFTTQHTDSHEVELTTGSTGSKNQQFSGISANIYSFQNGYYSMMSSLYGEQRALDPAGALVEAKKIIPHWGDVKPYMDKIKQDYLNNAQINVLRNKILNNITDPAALNNIVSEGNSLNDAMKKLGNSIGQYDPDGSFADHKEDTTKASDRYKYANSDKQAAYDNATEVTKALINKDTGTYADQATVETLTEAENDAWSALDGVKPDAEKTTPKVPSTKEPVANTSHLTDGEKAKVQKNVEDANKGNFPAGTTVKVGDDGTATITYPDTTTDTIDGSKLVRPATDAEKTTPTVPSTKEPVANTSSLTDGEKAKVQKNVEDANKGNFPAGTTVKVGDDGTATITYPDTTTDTIDGSKLVRPATDAEKTTPTVPSTKEPVANTSSLTDGEKAKVQKNVEDANKGNFPAGTTVKVGDDGTATITYPDTTTDTIDGSKLVRPATDAEKTTPTVPSTKEPVANTSSLTDGEKAKVQKNVEDANKGNFPAGTTVKVGDDGTATITYPDTTTDTIDGSKLVRPATDAEKTTPTVPSTKEPVANTSSLTDGEKAKVQKNVEDANKGNFPAGTTVKVGDDGTATITYPDTTTDTIDGSKLVRPATDAEKTTPTVPSTKEPVANTSSLTDGEKAKVQKNVEDANKGNFPAGTTVKVGDDGTATITYPDTTTDTIDGSKLVRPATDAEKTTPTVPSTKEPVANTSSLTDGEKAKVQKNVEDANKGNFPAGTTVKVGDDGTATITYPDTTTDTIDGSKLVRPATDAEKTTPTVPSTKEPVANTSSLTDGEKAKVQKNVEDANKGNFPAGTTVKVGDDGTATITYPDTTTDTIDGSKLVRPATDAEKTTPTVPSTKEPVANTSSLTDGEKAKVQKNVEDANKGNFPAGTTVKVGDDGTATITYPDTTTDTIDGSKLVRPATDAEKTTPTVPSTKEPVANTSSLTDGEKAKVQKNVEDANKGNFPAGTTVKVGDDGTATITYPDTTTDTIDGSKLVRPATDAEKTTPTVPSTKEPVANTSSLTDGEKAKVQKNVEDANKGNFPAGTTVKVGDDGTATITYPDTTTDTIDGSKLVRPATDAEKTTPTVPSTKEPVANTSSLTDGEKAKVQKNVEDANKGNFPAGTTVKVGDDGTATITYPDTTTDTIDGSKLVRPATDAEKTTPTVPSTKEPVANTSSLTDGEKAKVQKNVEDANKGNFPAGTTVKVGDDGTATITYPDTTTDTIDGSKLVRPATDAEKTTPTVPSTKEPVANTSSLTDGEKAKVQKNVEDANKGNFPAGTTVKVGDDGTATITYPDTTTDTIDGSKLVRPATDAEKTTPTVPSTKEPVANTSSLTDGEKAKVQKNVEDANKGNFPAGTTVKVGDDGTATITYPDTTTDTIDGSKLVRPATDAEKTTPTVPSTKEPVANTSSLTDGEKAKVQKNVEDANKGNFPAGTTVKVGDDGTATITYPDTTTDTIDGSKLVRPATDAEKTTPTVPSTKEPVANTSSLTDGEKAKVQKNVEDANKGNFPAGTTVKVGDDGTATITYPDTTTDTIDGSKLVRPATDAEKTTPTVPSTKEPVANTSSLTDGEKAKVQKNVEDANKGNFPAGTTVKVGDDGTATITYPDTTTDTIDGSKLVRPATDAEKTTPTVPSTKEPVANTSSLTDGEKAKVQKNVEDANKGNFPAGTDVTVGDDGTATVNYPDGSKDTIPGDQLVQGQKGDTTDAGNITPTVPGGKVTVKDPSHLTDDEKKQVKNNVDNANKDKFPAGTDVTVGDDGTATVNYPDGSKDTIPGDQLVQGQKGDTTDAGNITPTVPGGKVTVKDPSHLTDDEKKQVKNNVDNANKDKFPAGTDVTVGDDGTATVNYPDGSKDTIPGDQLVQGQKGDTTDAGNITPTVPGGKVTVKDPSHLTDDEKKQVKNNVDNANKDKFPAGTDVTVGDDGTATVNYPDGSKDTIPGDQLVQGQKGDTTDAGNITPTVPGGKVTVKDPSHLTDDEKKQVKNNVDNANKDKFPAGTDVTVGDDGTATVNYPDGSKDTIPGDQLVQGQKGDTTDAGNITPTVPGDKVTVKDPSHLTDDEKKQVKNNVDNANKDKFPDGTDVTVGDDGTATVTYPDGSKDTIPGDQLVQGQKGDTTDAGNITPNVPGDKVTVKDPSHLTEGEKDQVKTNVTNANKDKFPAGTEVTVGDDGTATVTYPDGSKDTIPGDQLVQGQKGDTTDAGNITPNVPGDKVTVKDPSHLTEGEKDQVKTNVTNANKDKFPAGTEVTVGDDGTATVTYPDGSKDTIPGDQLVQGQKGDTTDAGNITPNVPGDKVTVKDPSHLTEGEKDQVKTNVTNANKDKFPAGTEVTVGDDGTATVTYPDGSKDTIPGDQLVQGQKGDTTDAGNITPNVPGDKVTVKDPSHLTEGEKDQVKTNVTNANKDKFPAGTEVTVGDDGTATVTYPDGSKDTIPGDQLVQGQKGDTTDAGNITPTVPGDKVTVKDPSHLTEGEKDQVKTNVTNANKDKFPAGTEVTVGDDGTATVTYPDGSKDTIPGDQLVQGQKGDTTDAGNITPNVPGDKVTVKDPSHLTEGEKDQVKTNVTNANKDKFPAGTEVTVGDDGTATVTYPDGSKDTITGDQLVQGQKGNTTDAGNITPTVPGDKVTVKDPSHLTEGEKDQVKTNVTNANKDKFPAGTEVAVGNDGTATITYPDGSKDTIPGDQLVQGQKGDTTDAGNITPTIPGGKVTVKDPSHLTDDEKNQVKDNVDSANKDKFPAGTEVAVGNDGTATITYPDGSKDTIPGDQLVQGQKGDTIDAGNITPTIPGGKVTVKDPSHLTDDEKNQVKDNVDSANKDKFPAGTEVAVGNDGTATITYPDGSKDTIPGDQLVQGQKGATTDAVNITPNVPGDKVTVKDPSHLTEGEKNQVKNNVDNANKDKFPDGTTVTVGDDGTATVNYPDGSKDTITGDQLVQGQKGDTTDAGNITPNVPGDKVTVKDPSHLTDGEKDQVKNNVDNANKDKFPAGTEVTVGDDGTATVTYPDGSTNTIPGHDLVTGKTDADKYPLNPGQAVDVVDPNHLTQAEQDQVKEAIRTANPTAPIATITVDAAGNVQVTFADGSTTTLQANLHKHVTEATTGSATKPGAGTNGNQMKGATSTNQTATKQQAQQHLPQTGDQPAMWAMLSGLGVAFLGLLGLKKKRED